MCGSIMETFYTGCGCVREVVTPCDNPSINCPWAPPRLVISPGQCPDVIFHVRQARLSQPGWLEASIEAFSRKQARDEIWRQELADANGPEEAIVAEENILCQNRLLFEHDEYIGHLCSTLLAARRLLELYRQLARQILAIAENNPDIEFDNVLIRHVAMDNEGVPQVLRDRLERLSDAITKLSAHYFGFLDPPGGFEVLETVLTVRQEYSILNPDLIDDNFETANNHLMHYIQNIIQDPEDIQTRRNREDRGEREAREASGGLMGTHESLVEAIAAGASVRLEAIFEAHDAFQANPNAFQAPDAFRAAGILPVDNAFEGGWGSDEEQEERAIDRFVRSQKLRAIVKILPLTAKTSSKNFEIEPDCVVCKEQYGSARDGDKGEDPAELPCGHVVGFDCLCIWVKTKRACPHCRADLSEAYEKAQIL